MKIREPCSVEEAMLTPRHPVLTLSRLAYSSGEAKGANESDTMLPKLYLQNLLKVFIGISKGMNIY